MESVTKVSSPNAGLEQRWGEIESGLKLERLAIKFAPNSASAQNNLALYLSRINLNTEAMAPAIKACQLLPGHPGCEILVAVFEMRMGQADKARWHRYEKYIAPISPILAPTSAHLPTPEHQG